MTKIIRRSLIAIGCVLVALVGCVVVALWPKVSNMKSEYVTAGVIRDTGLFITKTDGQWPRSWADLGEDRSRCTDLNFSLDPVKATKDDVLGAIKPKSGRYYTYPHSKEDLEAVYNELRSHRGQAFAAAHAGDTSKPFMPRTAAEWLALSVSNLQEHADIPIIPSSVQFVVVNGHGLSSMNPWVVSRSGMHPSPFGPSGSRTIEIKLESDAAIDFLCRSVGVTNAFADTELLPPTWVLAFCDATNRCVGFKVLSDEVFHAMPDVQKAVDNNGRLLIHSRGEFASQFKGNKTVNHVAAGPREGAPAAKGP